MSVSIVQSATSATGSTAATSCAVGLTGVTTGHGCLGVLISSQPIYTDFIMTNGTLLASTGGPSPYMYVFRCNALVSGISMGGHFGTGTTPAFFAAYLVETTAASFTAVTGAGVTTVAATGSLPTTWLQTIGDLPFGFFGAGTATAVTPQSGWTQTQNLNSTAGQQAQLEVQTGPLSTATGQSVTAQATFATGSTYVGMLVSASASGPIDLTSQEFLEALGQDTALDRTSQVTVDVIGQGVPNVHASQDIVEIISADTALLRTSQEFIELIIPLYTRVSQDFLETLGQDTANVRTSQMIVEVLFSSQGQRRRTVDEEWTAI